MALRPPGRRLLALLLSLALIGLQCVLPGSCALAACGPSECCAGALAVSPTCEDGCQDRDDARCSDSDCVECRSVVHEPSDDSAPPDGVPSAPCDCGLPCCAGISLATPPIEGGPAPLIRGFVRSREPPAPGVVSRDPSPRPPRR